MKMSSVALYTVTECVIVFGLMLFPWFNANETYWQSGLEAIAISVPSCVSEFLSSFRFEQLLFAIGMLIPIAVHGAFVAQLHKILLISRISFRKLLVASSFLTCLFLIACLFVNETKMQFGPAFFAHMLSPVWLFFLKENAGAPS